MYAAGLTHLGEARMHPVLRLPVFCRPIGRTGRYDGIGAWPYLWVDDESDITALANDFGDLVTLAIVTQPGFTPGVRGNPVLLKQHYVYDPSLPAPALSQRARQRLRDSERVGTFTVVTNAAGRLEIAELYEGLKRRRTMAGIFRDMQAPHFDAIARLDGSVFFRVDSDTGIGAMACGVLFADTLQMLHIVPSEAGLHWNASYLLMHRMQEFARDQGVRLMTGGMPTGATEGLRIFKARWANALEPVYLLRIVNDPVAYAALCGSKQSGERYFPAYRLP
jgi:hypothetical protein